ncbi:CDP-alcohol phosphatidyltransferase family protein [Aestuariispira insulae]|uniref:Phosphatidylglycerophosphate synthase n=1 Tax=Aestuariispira insulae TaxID=1461337 RepID=A0A3D9HR86_9PROT|nr:CDP-alcohol phosphatidyltransferase family protein [Aestuariispira insulae]RED52002.1 phosphatidylglycerophosphate synthase [Aestuariispira insulae]
MDYFNEEERAKQKEFARWRDRALEPVTGFFIKACIRPWHITLFAVILLVIGVFIPVQGNLPVTGNWFYLSFCLFFYCVLDGFDGPLARRTGQAHEGGAMLDIAADQVGVAVVAAAATFHYGASPVFATLFSSAYLSFIALAIYANGRGVRLWGFLRVKYFFYFNYCLASLIGPAYQIKGFSAYDLPNLLMMVFSVYYIFYILHALIRIHRHFSLEGRTRDHR